MGATEKIGLFEKANFIKILLVLLVIKITFSNAITCAILLQTLSLEVDAASAFTPSNLLSFLAVDVSIKGKGVFSEYSETSHSCKIFA